MAEQQKEPSFTQAEYPGLHALLDEMLTGGRNARLATKMLIRSLGTVNDQRQIGEKQADA